MESGVELHVNWRIFRIQKEVLKLALHFVSLDGVFCRQDCFGRLHGRAIETFETFEKSNVERCTTGVETKIDIALILQTSCSLQQIYHVLKH